MTAEIAILNRSAIALAADSAVTVRSEFGHKMFDTANELFSRSDSVSPAFEACRNTCQTRCRPSRTQRMRAVTPRGPKRE